MNTTPTMPTMPTIAEQSVVQHHAGSPDACAGCDDASAADDIQPCRVTYVDGSVDPNPVHYCQYCRDIIAFGIADFVATAAPITS